MIMDGINSHVIDLKAQISKKILLIVTPYAGIGASYGRSRADAGMFVEPTVTRDGVPSSLDQMKEDLAAAEQALDELTGKDATGLIGEGEYDFSDIEIPTGEDAGFVVSSWVMGGTSGKSDGLSASVSCGLVIEGSRLSAMVCSGPEAGTIAGC